MEGGDEAANLRAQIIVIDTFKKSIEQMLDLTDGARRIVCRCAPRHNQADLAIGAKRSATIRAIEPASAGGTAFPI